MLFERGDFGFEVAYAFLELRPVGSRAGVSLAAGEVLTGLIGMTRRCASHASRCTNEPPQSIDRFSRIDRSTHVTPRNEVDTVRE
jgi:hypothetical protein